MSTHENTDATTGERPILVAIDFSQHSEAALRWAFEAATRFEAPLILLHVVHDPAAAPGYYVAADASDRPLPQEKVAEGMMSELEERIRGEESGVSELPGLTTLLVAGIPATRILEVAKKHDAQMIVMGSQGRTGLSNLLLGSKAQRVVQLSTLPVVVVRAPDDPAPAEVDT